MMSTPSSLSGARRWLYIILALALALRVGLMAGLLDNPSNFIQSDAGGYDEIATNLVAYGAFATGSAPSLQPDAFRTPLYPLFLAGIYSLFGRNYAVVVLIQCLLSLASAYLVFRLGQSTIGPHAGIGAALLMSIDAGLIIHANLLLTETVYTFLLILSLAALWRLAQTQQARYAAACGVGLGLGTLCRPVAQYLPLGLMLVALAFLQSSWSTRLRMTGILLLAYAATLSPWLIRNQIVFGAPQLSSIQGHNLLIHNTAYLRAQLDHTTLEEAQAKLLDEIKPLLRAAGDNPFRQAAIEQQVAMQEISHHPLTYLWVHTQGVVLMLVLPNTNFLANMLGILTVPTGLIANLRTRTLSENYTALSRFFQDYLSNSPRQAIFFIALTIETMTLLATYLLSCVGVGALARSKRWLILGLLLVTLAYFTALTGPVGYGRYRVPLSPVLALLAGAGADAWVNRRTQKQESHGTENSSAC